MANISDTVHGSYWIFPILCVMHSAKFQINTKCFRLEASEGKWITNNNIFVNLTMTNFTVGERNRKMASGLKSLKYFVISLVCFGIFAFKNVIFNRYHY